MSEVGENKDGLVSEGSDLKDFYAILKHLEAQPSDMDEKIYVGNITPESPEYTRLIDAGIGAKEISGRRIPREKLLSAGFVFNNTPLFAMEKPLINLEIKGIDFSKRKLLTGNELQEILVYQREHPDLYGSDGIADDDFRMRLLSYLLTAEQTIPPFIRKKLNFYRMCLSRIGMPEDRKSGPLRKLDSLYEKLIQMHRDNIMSGDYPIQKEQAFVDENLQDVMPWTEKEPFVRFDIVARGRDAMLVESRRNKLNGFPSPFLTSGFHFPYEFGNPDYTVIGQGDRLFRVNMMVWHLTSRNMSEMGEGTDGVGEQDYAIGRYIENLEPRDEKEKNDFSVSEERNLKLKLNYDEKKLVAAVQEKLKRLAMTWADGPNSPDKAKKIAGRIMRLEERLGRSNP